MSRTKGRASPCDVHAPCHDILGNAAGVTDAMCRIFARLLAR